jgi:hypothetical protein
MIKVQKKSISAYHSLQLIALVPIPAYSKSPSLISHYSIRQIAFSHLELYQILSSMFQYSEPPQAPPFEEVAREQDLRK